ncbi:MAG: hypothetical protein RLZZ164_292 [Actinomycetota bacterium]|jgi:hypothetical protein
MDTNALLLILLGLLAALFAQAYVVARTAKSKGYSFVLFLIFGLVSPFLTSVFAMFLKPKGAAATNAPTRRVKLTSLFGFVAGLSVEVYGLAQLPVTDKMSDQQIIDALSTTTSMGCLTVAAAGVLLMIASVANEAVKSTPIAPGAAA